MLMRTSYDNMKRGGRKASLRPYTLLELLFVYNSKVFRLTNQQMTDLYRFNIRTFGAGELIKELGFDPEILPQMFEKLEEQK